MRGRGGLVGGGRGGLVGGSGGGLVGGAGVPTRPWRGARPPRGCDYHWRSTWWQGRRPEGHIFGHGPTGDRGEEGGTQGRDLLVHYLVYFLAEL